MLFEKINVIVDEKSTWRVNTPSQIMMNFPYYLLEWGKFIAFKEYFTMRENSMRYLLFHTLSGEGKLLYDNKEYRLGKNSVAVIGCEKKHYYQTASEEPWVFNWFHFNGVVANEYYWLFNQHDLYIPTIHSDGEEAKLISSIVANNNINDIHKALLVAQDITRLMTLLISSRIEIQTHEFLVIREKIEKAIKFMGENLMDKISIADIADSVFMSRYHFSRVFKINTGIAPYAYLTNLRVTKVKEMLVHSEKSLEEIAVHTGFADAKTLIYNFKKVTALTPLQYKKSNDFINVLRQIREK